MAHYSTRDIKELAIKSGELYILEVDRDAIDLCANLCEIGVASVATNNLNMIYRNHAEMIAGIYPDIVIYCNKESDRFYESLKNFMCVEKFRDIRIFKPINGLKPHSMFALHHEMIGRYTSATRELVNYLTEHPERSTPTFLQTVKNADFLSLFNKKVRKRKPKITRRSKIYFTT